MAEVRSVLVTGGAGTFGRYVARQLRSEGWVVRVFDRLERPPWATEGDVDYRRGDICDAEAVDSAVEGTSSVLHAAFARPELPAPLIGRVNVDGTRNVLRAARTAGCARVVLLSSTIVERSLRTHPLLREAPVSRLCAYRESRVVAEREALEAAGELSTAVAVPRTFVSPTGTGAFALVFETIAQGGPVPVLGAGRNRYQLLDMRDLAGGLCALIGTRAAGRFYFGSERFGSVAEDLGALVEHAGTGARLCHLPAAAGRLGVTTIELLGLAPLSEWHRMCALGEDSVADISRATIELGWRPAYGNVEALVDSYDGYAAQGPCRGATNGRGEVPTAHRALQKMVASVLRRCGG